MSEAFLKIVNMSIAASWLVFAVMVLRCILKKAPKWVNVLLWGIVAVRLLCPFSVESALSLIPSAETISPEIMTDWTPEISTGIEPLNEVVNPFITASFAPEPSTSANPLQILIPVWANIWLLGVLVMLLYTAFSYWHLRKKMSTAVILRDNIFRSEYTGSPFVLGIIKPRIYLPYRLDDKSMVHVIAHEQAHIRRKDHWWKPLGFLLLTIHWFNPIMWIAYILLCRDIELACDEKVIKDLANEQRADYTQALVVCSVNRHSITACPLAFGEIGVRDRVKSVMNYKKPAFWIIVTAVIVCVIVAVCFLTNPKQDSFSLKITVPAGSQEQFVYADEEISPTKNHIIISSGEGLGDTEVVLKTVQVQTKTAYEPTYLTPGMPVKMEAEKGGWFKLGISMQNPTDEDIVVYVNVENVQVRIVEEVTPDHITFEAEILEIHDGYFLVKPEYGWQLNSADKIEVPMKNMDPALEPQIGDIIEIRYSGELLETYPARISDVHSIRVIQEKEQWDLIPMVMVGGELYLDTGIESTIEARCGVMDGKITSEVDGNQTPTQNDQSNFGTGYGYQYGPTEGTIELCMNDKWWIFATEEARREIQFPSKKTVFELNFAGNSSLCHEIAGLTEEMPYWSIFVKNEGSDTIAVEIMGNVYKIAAGTSHRICAKEKTDPGNYSVSFSSMGASGMEGYTVCEISSVETAEMNEVFTE